MPARPHARDAFREGVFARDRHRCVACGAPAVDAHHLIERRLFPDGGYILDNGVSLCAAHHRDAEATTLSCEALRAAAGITRTILPPHLHPDRRYDKWGNPVLRGETRLRGELYFEEPVQKILAPLRHQFHPRSEDPRLPLLPWSPHAAVTDFVLDPAALADLDLVLHADPPGPAVLLDATGLYFGTGEPLPDPTPDLLALPIQLADLLPPEGHLAATLVASTLLITAAWDGHRCLPWDETLTLAELLNLPVATTLARGPLTDLTARAPSLGPHRLRPAGTFNYSAVRRLVARA